MNLPERLHAIHRIWRYRLRSERDEIRHLLSLDLSGTTIIDVGAHRGAYTHWMSRKAGKEGRVIAFEPQPELHAYLERMAGPFRWGNVTLGPFALSSHEGSAQLSRPRHWGAASLEPVPEEGPVEHFEVPLTSLDAYRARHPELPRVGFVKIDVQDHELPVLQGATGTLESCRPEILFECVDHIFRHGRIHQLLDSLGYSGFFFYRRELVPVEKLSDLREKIPAPYLNYVYRERASLSGRNLSHG